MGRQLNAGASVGARGERVDRLPRKSNYFTGSDPKLWRTDAEQFSKVRYSDVYEGIGLVY